MDLTYWLVRHPRISHFTWQKGETLGSSNLFLVSVVFWYLSLTYLLSHVPLIPTLSPKFLKRITAVHNMLLLSLSLTMVCGSFFAMLSTGPDVRYIICLPKNTKPDGPLFFWAYVFYLSKLTEFLDTLLIITGKSFNRLTFLHVFHHATIVVQCYVMLNTSQSSFPMVVLVNSFVHVVMYTYYLLCSMGIRPKWKKLLTDFQILQFASAIPWAVMLIYYHLTGPGCSGMLSWCFNGVFVASLIFLFLDFRTKCYDTNKTKSC